ncbi:CCA tRNA nucleotidyltransferase 1, mitochondrial-like [Gigantopelta aegis]|uniref:CCA tRNA nucleotidyltransferase 1, mitochondrial-like n=1 Tax=Gigantopelta aegis TaxID=1735272 RepID=UPI001B88C82C|nr:CCA tRNA nucleotidyltransferase 1, mitochondrial-like [Gigantopelta aegis]XP_041353636.1 CCA tRNA nucleotidyltransferase 1, mitochondrial-like [Gigantopelta aegis]
MLLRRVYSVLIRKILLSHQRYVHPSKKGNLATMKLDSPQFKSLFTPELTRLVSIFKKYDHELRIAGGAVRDLLMGIEPHDVDFATTATPDEMKELFELEGVRMINNKGEKHGTITARINDKDNFEVTTLRIDVVTDGRHAEVEFTRDWQLDANRRDLTINAMFLGFDGTVYDYFNGMSDLQQRCLRFVGNASERIQEDYLRILRYFRFYGRIAKGPKCHEEETLAAIKKNASGLAGVSGERIWVELKKIIVGNFASSIIDDMVSLGVGEFIGFPPHPDLKEFHAVCERTVNLSPQCLTLMSGLFQDEQEVYILNKRLKMSNEEVKLGLFIVKHRSDYMTDRPVKYCMDLLIDSAGKEPKVKDKICELLKYHGEKELLQVFTAWTPPPFPVTGYDLVERKVPKGPIFTKTLNELRQIWKKSDFKMSKEDLLAKIDEVVKTV